MTGNKKRRPIGKRETEEVAATERKKVQHKSTHPRYVEVRCCAGLKMMEVTDDGDDDDDDNNDFDCDGNYFEEDDDDDDDEEGSHST